MMQAVLSIPLAYTTFIILIIVFKGNKVTTPVIVRYIVVQNQRIQKQFELQNRYALLHLTAFLIVLFPNHPTLPLVYDHVVSNKFIN